MHRLDLEQAHLMAEEKTASALDAKQKDTESLQKLFLNLRPHDIQGKLVDYLNCKQAVDLSQLSLFPAALNKSLVNNMVRTVLQGDLSQAEILIGYMPSVALLKGTATDCSSRTLDEVTPFQAALCAWDIEMCEMLRKYMHPEEVVRQYQEIFPQGHEGYLTLKPFDFSELVDEITQSPMVDITAALAKQQNDSLLCQTLNQFRINFTHCSKQEKVFNPHHFIKAYQLYDAHCEQWEYWDRRDLFWRQVIGYVQRFLPANIAQNVAQGLYYRVALNEKALRSFNFRLGGRSIFPLDFNSPINLGYDFAGNQMGMHAVGGQVSTSWVAREFSTLMFDRIRAVERYSKVSSNLKLERAGAQSSFC